MQMNLARGFGVVAFANLVEAPLHPCAIVLYAMRVLRAQSLGQPLPSPGRARIRLTSTCRRLRRDVYRPQRRVARRSSQTSNRLRLVDGSKSIALYPRGADAFWADDPKYAMFLLVFGRERNGRVVEMTYGSQWYPNERYRGPHTFSYPAAWNALAGRYENTFLGDPGDHARRHREEPAHARRHGRSSSLCQTATSRSATRSCASIPTPARSRSA